MAALAASEPEVGSDVPVVTWNAEHTEGVKKTKFSETIVLPPRLAVQDFVKLAFLQEVERPARRSLNLSTTLGRAEPEFPLGIKVRMRDQVATLMPQWVDTWRHEIRQKVEHMQSDTEFLGALTRDYRKGCAICLTDQIMGTTCSCGHTEIAVFRPCGHAMCVHPCFEQWMKSNHIHFAAQELTFGEQRFVVAGKLDLSSFPANQHLCPECRTPLRSVFRAEEISPPPDLPWTDWADVLMAVAGFVQV